MNAHVARTERHTSPTESPWLPLWLAVAALAAAPVVGGVIRLLRALVGQGTGQPGLSPGMLGVAVTILVSGIGVWVAVRALRHGIRTWPVWTGLVMSGMLLLLWVAFSVAEIAYPH